MSVDVWPDGRRDRLRPAGRHLRACRSPAARRTPLTHRHRVGHAAALLARRQADRLHLRSRRRRQHLGDERATARTRRQVTQGRLPPAEQPGLDARTASTSRRASTSPARARSARARSGCTTARGGEGVQLTEKPNEQKDLGEPAFSPDGRYLYYSAGRHARHAPSSTTRTPTTRSTTSSASTVQTGEIEPFVTGPGGVGPADALARRQARSRSSAACATSRTLFVKDLASGAGAPDLGRPRARHAGDLGDPRRLPGMAWTPGRQVDRRSGRGGKHPARRRRARSAVPPRSRST